MTQTILNPADLSFVDEVAHTDLAAVEQAIIRARDAQRSWAKRSPFDRARTLRAFAVAVDSAVEELARLETANSGHPITQARAEAAQVRDVLDYYAGVPERLIGQQIPVTDGMNITFHEPIGVIGVITPWNFPLTIAAWALAPALAAGNAVLLKPAVWTPLTSLKLADLALVAGVPEHLFQVLPGRGDVVGECLIGHPAVGKIVFTGSTETGKRVMAGCASRIKPVTLELGGKSANIICDDADVELAAAMAPSSVFDNAGQDCCARSRLLVQSSIYDRFMAAFETAVQKFRVGNPLDPKTQMGPLVTTTHRERVASFITPDVEVLFRGQAPATPGAWYPPTVVASLPGDQIATEEVFGPVVSVIRFESEAEAIDIANATEFGLSGSVWTQNLGRAIRISRAVESGNLSVNSHSSVRYTTPFGGMKQSGLGRELGPDAALAFTETKSIFFADR